jgi:hypothetical protein
MRGLQLFRPRLSGDQHGWDVRIILGPQQANGLEAGLPVRKPVVRNDQIGPLRAVRQGRDQRLTMAL